MGFFIRLTQRSTDVNFDTSMLYCFENIPAVNAGSTVEYQWDVEPGVDFLQAGDIQPGGYLLMVLKGF